MSSLGWAMLALAAVAAVLAAGWLVWTATRLDRIHLKAETAEATLRECLARRASTAIELASTGLSDPASAVLLMQAASSARGRDEADWGPESALTQTIRVLGLDSVDGDPLRAALMSAERQASIARRIHNDVAARAADLRSRRRVRWFRLAGRARPPVPIVFDDGS